MPRGNDPILRESDAIGIVVPQTASPALPAQVEVAITTIGYKEIGCFLYLDWVLWVGARVPVSGGKYQIVVAAIGMERDHLPFHFLERNAAIHADGEVVATGLHLYAAIGTALARRWQGHNAAE